MANDERQLFRRIFRTAHRILLERCLRVPLAELTGDVLVLGAGHEKYRQILVAADSVCLTDADTGIDGLDRVMDAHHITFENESFDTLLAIEVFEHLQYPAVAASEVHRVLRSGGRALISIPYMFHVHGDPYDFQRFTANGLETLFHEFASVSVEGFGGRCHVISDIITTASRAVIPLRILNPLISLPIFSAKPSKDSPSGFIVQLIK